MLTQSGIKSIIDVPLAVLDSPGTSVLHATSAGAHIAADISVRGALDGLSASLKDVTHFVGELAGGLLGGMAEAILDAVKDDIVELAEELKLQAEDLLKYATDELKDVLDDAFEKLDAAMKALVNRVIYMTRLLNEVVTKDWARINESVLTWFFEASIAGYDSVSTLPFAKRLPRLVYLKPTWIRGGPAIDGSFRLVVRGNELDRFKTFELNGVKVEPQDFTPNQVSFELPDEVLGEVRRRRAGRFSLVLLAEKKLLFGSDIRQRRELPVLPELELAVEAEIWPVYNQVGEGTMPAEWNNEGTDDDSRSVTIKHQVPRPDAQFVGYKKVFIKKNKDSYLKNSEITGGGKVFAVTYYLEGDGGWPFEAKAWFHYKYDLTYRFVDKDKCGDIVQVQASGPDVIDESLSEVTQVFAHPKRKELLHDESVQHIRWKYRCSLRVLAYDKDTAASRVVLDRRIDDDEPASPEIAGTIRDGELVLRIMSAALLGDDSLH